MCAGLKGPENVYDQPMSIAARQMQIVHVLIGVYTDGGDVCGDIEDHVIIVALLGRRVITATTLVRQLYHALLAQVREPFLVRLWIAQNRALSQLGMQAAAHTFG